MIQVLENFLCLTFENNEVNQLDFLNILKTSRSINYELVKCWKLESRKPDLARGNSLLLGSK